MTCQLRVAQVVEQTTKRVAFKAPKTGRSRRPITLPSRKVDELRALKRTYAESRLKLGLGRDGLDLVFPTILEGGPRNPELFSKEFAREAASAGVRT